MCDLKYNMISIDQTVDRYDDSEKAVMATLSLSAIPEKTIAKLNLPVFFYARNDRAILKLFLYEGTLKHFFDDPENYYYFPEDDVAYHADMARFADRSKCRKASRKTAYTKNTSVFIPVSETYASLSHDKDDLLFRKTYQNRQEYILFNSETDVPAVIASWADILVNQAL